MDDLVKPRCIELLKTHILLRMRQDYEAALRTLPGDDPNHSGLKEKLDVALDMIEAQLRTRGLSQERRDLDAGVPMA